MNNKANQFPGDNSEWEPPDSIPNSEVKPLSANDSVGSPHVKVGHRQDFNLETLANFLQGFFFIDCIDLAINLGSGRLIFSLV